MKSALIFDDDDDSGIIIHLLLNSQGYDVLALRYMQECLRILSYTKERHLVFLGTSVDALATLIAAAEAPELQRHVYIHVVERGLRLPRYAKQVVAQFPLLTIPKPLHMETTLRMIALAEQHLK
jgi:DNA-binding NtrC family response regulator